MTRIRKTEEGWKLECWVESEDAMERKTDFQRKQHYGKHECDLRKDQNTSIHFDEMHIQEKHNGRIEMRAYFGHE